MPSATQLPPVQASSKPQPTKASLCPVASQAATVLASAQREVPGLHTLQAPAAALQAWAELQSVTGSNPVCVRLQRSSRAPRHRLCPAEHAATPHVFVAASHKAALAQR